MALPEKFLARMREMLGDEFDAFLASYAQPHRRGLRINPLKCEADALLASLPFPAERAPFSPLSYYAPPGVRMTDMPLYHAGAFYAQEPSAASAVTVLAPEPGERVLDLCAAPGGKSGQIAALTGDSGLLWANEIVPERARVLSSNLERLGVRRAVISSAHPAQLAERLRGYFDRVLVDAPCSGEGMFRRDPRAAEAWSEAHVAACAERQTAILESAVQCLRPGGVLVYSTCTFSEEENEGVVRKLLAAHPELEPDMPPIAFGRPARGTPGVRIYPMDGGEGHFAVRFRRTDGPAESPVLRVQSSVPAPEKTMEKAVRSLFASLFFGEPGRIALVGDHLFLLPEDLPPLSGLPILRAGVQLAEIRKNRLEPAHGAFMAMRPENCRSVLRLASDDPAVFAFLRGEEIEAPGLSGYAAVAVSGVVTGFGKASGGVLKNRYPKGLRMLRTGRS